MKKFLIELIIFILIIILIIFGINLFQSKYNNGEKHYKKQYDEIFSHKVHANAIIIGTSHAVHSIRPSLLNSIKQHKVANSKNELKFYNFSFNGSNPKFYNIWYNEIFKLNYIKPKLIIIGVDWFIFDDKWLWRNLEQDSEYLPSNLFWNFWWNNHTNSRKFCKTDLVVNRFPFLKYRKNIKYSLLLWEGNPDFPIEKYDNGFIPFQKIMTMESSKPTNNIVKINLIQVQFFKNLIKQLKEENIKLVFVMSPEFNLPIEFYHNLESLKVISEIANKHNIYILNYNTDLRSEINYDETLFSDWGHMNEKGSKVFSKQLAKDLKKLNF